MSEETREAKELRWRAEYLAYVAECVENNVEYINFLNWSFRQKLRDKGPKYVEDLMVKIKADKEKNK